MSQNLRIPGPTPCPEDVLLAGALPMINHRGKEFRDLITRVHERLQQVFATKNDVLIITSSGTGSMEAAIANTLSPGDRLLCVSIGSFGDRAIEIGEMYGANVTAIRNTPGTAADPEELRSVLKQDPEIKAVFLTHNETSTGVTNDLETLAGVVREHEKLLLVDAISSLGCVPLLVDDWGCDVVATASQKGFMVPPGLAFASVSPRAWEASKEAKMPRYYFDFALHKSYYELGQTPTTPAVSVLFSLDRALDKMLEGGMEAVYRRHAHIGSFVREEIRRLGLELLVQDERYASNTVTAVKVPEGVKAGQLVEMLRTEHNVIVAGGQGALAGKIFRIGHMGYIVEDDISAALEALRLVLTKVGFKTGAGGTGF